MPLALELAAPWIRTLSCGEIAAELECSLDFLATSLRNIPERHRSLRVVFEQTWVRLSPAEQGVLMHLSVFRGGCTRDAAVAVANATLPVLASLVDRALLRRTNVGRYELHELIRQFAESRIVRDSDAVEQCRQKHQSYFIAFLEACIAGVKGPQQAETLGEIEADIDNVRLAWRGAIRMRDADAIARAADTLFIYYLYRNGYDEGQSAFRRAVAAIAGLPDTQSDDRHLLALAVPRQEQALVGYLLASLGYFVAHRRNLPQGQKLLELALSLVQQEVSMGRQKEAFARLWLGWAHYFQGQLTEAKRYAKASLTVFDVDGDSWAGAWALLLLGNSLRDGRPSEAVAAFQSGLDLWQESGYPIALSYLCINSGAAATMLGDYRKAQQHIALGVTISQQLNNVLGLGYSLLRRGQLEIVQGQYRPAIQTLRQSWMHFNRVGTVHASRAQFNLALAYHRIGDLTVAGQLYSQAFDGFLAANNKLERAHCLNGFGCLAYDQSDVRRAEKYHRESLTLLHETEPEPALLAVTLHYLGRVLISCGNERLTEANDLFRQALKLAQVHQLAPLALEICLAVPPLLVQTGDNEFALNLLLLAEQHSAATFATKRRAQQLLREMAMQSPQKTIAHRGQMLDLWAAVQALRATLQNK
ncbi:MAG: hypothetical protein R3C14_51020 [Caldilineaceae bacterium]